MWREIIFIITLIFSNFTIAQYCNTATTNDAITPSTSVQYSSTYNSGRRAFNFYAIAGNEYTFSTVGESSVDTYLRLYSNSTGGSVLAESDDYNNTQSEITWYCSVSGNYSVLLTRWSVTSSCAALNGNARIKYQMGSSSGSTIVSIGNGEGVVYQVPVNHYYKFGWSEMIYLKSEINTVGNITKIRFQCDPGSPTSYVAENQKIYMAHTTYSQLPNVVVKENAQTNYSSSNYMLVYSGTITWTIGWVEIVLDTPFPWNNTDNLIIKYENREGTFSASYPMFYYTGKTATVGYNYQDVSYPTSDGTRDGFRPNIKLAISDIIPLPVTLIEFNGVNKGSDNYIYWKTSSEVNCSHYNIQRFKNDDWITITTINGSGNSNNVINYSVTDFNPPTEINYYRLQQVDFNGYSEIWDAISIDNRINELKVVKTVNMLGQEVPSDYKGHVIITYEDGSIKNIFRN